ncbi:MAG: N-acetylmuramoyl-L-alanine amidase, partial [uncultured Gemmatimonadaceae bacterium]
DRGARARGVDARRRCLRLRARRPAAAAAARRRGRRPRRPRSRDDRTAPRAPPRHREGRHPRGLAQARRRAALAGCRRADDPHHRHARRPRRPRPDRERQARRPLSLRARERGQHALARAGAGARLRDLLPRRGQDRGGEPRGADGERGGALRDGRQRPQGRPAQLHHQRHGAERAPPRVERPRGRDPARDGARAPRAEPRGEAGELRRAPHLVHARRARGDRLRDQRRGGRLPHRPGGAGAARRGDRRGHRRLPRPLRAARRRLRSL